MIATQEIQKKPISLESILSMVKFHTDRFFAKYVPELTERPSRLVPSPDHSMVFPVAPFTMDSVKNRLLQNYALCANAAFIYLKRKYEIVYNNG